MVQHHDIFWLFEIVMLSLSVFPFFDGDYVSPFCCDSGIRECKWLWCVTLCVCLCLHFLFFLLMEHGGNYRVQWWIRAVEYCVCCPLCYCCILGGDSLFTRLFCRRVYLMQREEGKSKCGQKKKRWSALRGFTNGLKTGKSNDIAFVCNISVLLFGVLISISPRNPPTTFLPIYFVSHSLLPLFLSVSVLPILMGHVVCSRFVSWVSCGFYCVETYRLNPLPTRNLLWFWLFGLVNNSIVC